jgi:hypothetical protein
MDSKVPEMDWPAQSLQLNPIEHLWDELKRRLRSRPLRPTSLFALATALQEEWVAGDVQTPGGKSGRGRAVTKATGGAQPVLISMTEKCVTEEVGLQF